MNNRELYEMAVAAAKKAYSPYSKFCVGAALLCDDGTVYTGCNIENASYSVTVCAERVALFTAVAEGKRGFTAIAVAGSGDGDFSSPCPPCGVCRQALAEFCSHDMPVILSDGNGGVAEHTLGEILPMSFTAEDMEK